MFFLHSICLVKGFFCPLEFTFWGRRHSIARRSHEAGGGRLGDAGRLRREPRPATTCDASSEAHLPRLLAAASDVRSLCKHMHR